MRDESDGYPCPNCDDGVIRQTSERADGYPIEECNNCNTFALIPVEGKEPPLRRILCALHEVGCEPGWAEADNQEEEEYEG